MKFFKLFQSWRHEHVWYDDEQREQARLLCIGCELNIRRDEWEDMTEEQRALAGVDYCTLESIRSEQKTRAKGSLGKAV